MYLCILFPRGMKNWVYVVRVHLFKKKVLIVIKAF